MIRSQLVNQPLRRSFRFAVAAGAALACAGHAPRTVTHAERPPARYLFAWAGDEDREDSDFLAVIDLDGTATATEPSSQRRQ
jgi:hypothetical protein